jgi:hypothetical protein
MADVNAAAIFAQSYEPYGNVLDVAADARTPYGFTGEWMDRTGLAHLRARSALEKVGCDSSPDIALRIQEVGNRGARAWEGEMKPIWIERAHGQACSERRPDRVLIPSLPSRAGAGEG